GFRVRKNTALLPQVAYKTAFVSGALFHHHIGASCTENKNMQGIDSGPVMPPGKPAGKMAVTARTGDSKTPSLRLYNLLAKLPGPRNFAVRIFMFSFIGTQLPLFALLLYVLVNVELTAEMLTTFSIVLIA